MYDYARVIHWEREREAANYRLAHSIPRRRRSRAGAGKATIRQPSSIK